MVSGWLPGNFTSSLKFVFYVNGQAVDVETVPMVVDGSDGKDGESITAAGHWESATPYAKNSTVSFAGGSYLSKVETSNPPIKIAKFRNGRLRRKRDAIYPRRQICEPDGTCGLAGDGYPVDRRHPTGWTVLLTCFTSTGTQASRLDSLSLANRMWQAM